MDVNTLQQFITNVGFPIACVIALGWFIYTAFNKITAQSSQREEKLYTIVADAQETNKTLLKTNADFLAVLEIYKTDLETIKNDVASIKENMKG
jgi:hypothetical protein